MMTAAGNSPGPATEGTNSAKAIGKLDKSVLKWSFQEDLCIKSTEGWQPRNNAMLPSGGGKAGRSRLPGALGVRQLLFKGSRKRRARQR